MSKNLTIALLLAGTSAVMPVVAYAQTAPGTQPAGPIESTTPTSSDQDSGIGDIIVTAQRRTERLQDVPVSVQVISSEQLANGNRNSLEALSETVPGVHVSSAGTFSNQLYIRGIGSSGNPAFDQSVATFVDGIYYGRSRATGATFLDLDRIEVLKGPQSTFFGNNAIAGALNIVTKKPGNQFDADFRGLYGMYGQYVAEGEVTVPLADTFSIRAAVIGSGQTRWIKNVTTGNKAPEQHNEAGRITSLWNPTSNFDATLKVEVSRNRTKGTDLGLPQQWNNCPAPAPIGANQGGVFCGTAIALGVPIGIENDTNAGLAGQGTLLKTFGSALTLNYRTDSGLTFTSVSAFTNYRYKSQGDQIGVGTFLNTHAQTERYDQFSQELRLTSPSGKPIEYLAGLYFQTDKVYEDFDINAPFVNGLAPILGIPSQYLPIAWDPGFNQKEKVYSAFGSVTWTIVDRLKLSGGLRYSVVDKDFAGFNRYGTSTQIYGGYTPIPSQYEVLWSVIQGPPGATRLSRTDRALLPSAKLQYEAMPNVMFYASYAKGFKAGGYNGVIPNNTPENLQFGPEHVNAYEVGIKSKFFDNKVLFNLTAFRSDYSDLQVDASIFLPAVNAYTTIVRNAASSRAQGLELETQWAVTRNFRLSANITYLDSKYLSYPNASPSNLQTYCKSNYVLPYCSVFPNPVPSFRNLAGGKTRFAPTWSGSVNASYSADLFSGYKLTTELSPYFTSKYNQDEVPYVVGTDAYVRLDARISLLAPNGKWSLDVIGKNLTDKTIIANASIYVAQKEQPRNVALQVRYHF